MKTKLELGDEVRHIHTGFKGVATSRATYLSGCDRVTISPKVGKDGKLGDACSFDEPEIEVLKAKKVKRRSVNTGGWQPKVSHYLK